MEIVIHLLRSHRRCFRALFPASSSAVAADRLLEVRRPRCQNHRSCPASEAVASVPTDVYRALAVVAAAETRVEADVVAAVSSDRRRRMDQVGKVAQRVNRRISSGR